MPKGPVETPITDSEIAFAHLILTGKLTDREAAEAVGISPGQASYVKAKGRVKKYMAPHRASVKAAMVEHESATLVELNINRETIMARYWELSQLAVTQTNGNIAGQVRALDSLREMLGLVGPSANGKPGKDSQPRPNIYRAEWLRKAEGEEVDEDDQVASDLSHSSDHPKPGPGPELVKVEQRPAVEPSPIPQPLKAALPPRLMNPLDFPGEGSAAFRGCEGQTSHLYW